jgi:cytochrome c553
MGVQPATPGLLGLPRDYLLAELGAWRTLERHAMAPDCMAEIAKRLSPEDVGAVTTWLSQQTVPVGGKPEPVKMVGTVKAVNAGSAKPGDESPALRCGSAVN